MQLKFDEFSVVQASQVQQLSDHGKSLELISERFAQYIASSDSLSTNMSPSSTIINDDRDGQLICANHILDLMQRHQSTEEHATEPCRKPNKYSTIRIRASRYRMYSCEGWCSCKCHKPYSMGSPQQ